MATIFEDLRADHDRHRALLSAIADAAGDRSERARLFEAFRVEVSGHAAAEEQSLYATMMMNPETQEEARHSVAEHKEINDMLTDLYALEVDTLAWRQKFAVMRTRYDHHISEEEEEMFPAADQQMTLAEEARLGAVYEHRKPAEERKAAATDPTETDERE